MMYRGKTLIITAVVCVSAGIAGALAWRHYTHSPQYALRQIADAVHEHNRLKFERYVDLERFSTSAVDEMVARITLGSVDDADTGFGALGAMLGASMVKSMKPALASELRAAVLGAVEDGRFDSLFVAQHDTTGRDLTLAVVARNTSADRIHFAGMGELHREGDVATVGLQLRNDMFDTTLVLRIRLERGPDRWRMVAPDNLRDYLKAVDDLQQRRLATVNYERRKRMRAMLSVGPVHRAIRTYEWFSDDVILTTRLRNTGRDTIETVLLTLYADGDTVDRRELPLGVVTPIAPGKSAMATSTLDYNQFIDWHRRVRYADEVRAEPWYVITRHGSERDTLYEYNNWSEYAARF
jgi:hypothetical protein